MKNFKVDDKVFGKVKGYPAWPARITKVNGKRYSVVFYGTNETATINQDNIFYYLSNKPTFGTIQKRKYFAEAIADIEEDIKKCGGSDGNDNKESDISQKEPAPKRVKGQTKRKRTSTINLTRSTTEAQENTEAQQAKKLKLADQNHNDSNVTSENNDSENTDTIERSITPESTTSSQLSEITDFQINNSQDLNSFNFESSSVEITDGNAIPSVVNSDTNDGIKEESEKSENEDESKIKELDNDETSIKMGNDSIIESTDDEICKIFEKQLDLKDVNLLPEFYLTAITLYADSVEDNSHYYQTISPDPISLDDPSDQRLKVLPVKLGMDNYSGIIYTPPNVNKFRCEYDRAMKDAKIVEDILELKAEIEVGAIELHDDRLIKNLGCDDNYIINTTNLALIAYKKNKLQWLQCEVEIFKHIVSLKKCLSIQVAKIDDALILLEKLLEAPIYAISLKKRSFFVDTIFRLCRYVGNTKDWNLTPEETIIFDSGALKIREAAEAVYKKIRDLFGYGQEDNFLDKFDEDCEKFNEATKRMTQAEVFSLCAEPSSRKAQLEMIFDKEANDKAHSDNF